MRAITLALLLAAPAARADTSWAWGPGDLALEATFAGVTTVDWLYTLEFTQHRERYNGVTEWNPLLGKTPSRAKVNTLIPLAIVGHVAVASALPHGPLRTIWQAAWTYVELDAVRANWAWGIRLRW